MAEMISFLIGIVVGAVAIFPYLLHKRKQLNEQLASAKDLSLRASIDLKAAEAKRVELQKTDLELSRRHEEFNARIVTYDNLQQENQILKRDLQNVDVNLNKLELDRRVQQKRQEALNARSQELGARYLRETVKAVVAAVGPNNFVACKQKLINAIQWCREIGFEIPHAEETKLMTDLRAEFERAVKAEFEREEQARIKAQIREEQRLQKEVETELRRLERERAAIQAALDRALADANNQHNEEVQRLQARLAEAEEKSKRAISLAQQTKAGHVYVISNIGSFGNGVFKIGMTRRLDPKERVDELGSASVPFPFDVHMMIHCKDAPALENALHRSLHKLKINKVNPRKEYFRTDIQSILEIVKEHHGEVQYVVDPEALQYHQSLNISEQDEEYIEQVFNQVEDEEPAAADDV